MGFRFLKPNLPELFHTWFTQAGLQITPNC